VKYYLRNMKNPVSKLSIQKEGFEFIFHLFCPQFFVNDIVHSEEVCASNAWSIHLQSK
jgi:hypothetical protein